MRTGRRSHGWLELSTRGDSDRLVIESRDRAIRLGALDYITKPFDPLALPVRIEKILKRVGATTKPGD